MRYDALIIGAGMSGLAAGIRLAQFGRRVAVLERHTLWGGLNSFYKFKGRRLDSGLHALTNFAPPSAKSLPLNRVLRALRIPRDALQLAEQRGSRVAFPQAELRFSNDFELLRSEVARAFPHCAAGFDRLVAELPAYAAIDDAQQSGGSARAELARYLPDPLLVEMLLCPILYYGSPTEHDLDWASFTVLFRGILMEGFARPIDGVKPLLDALVKRFKEAGGELRMRSGVQRVVLDRGAARGVVLDDGAELEADVVLSSAGWVETLDLAGRRDLAEPDAVGRLSFVESLSITDVPTAALGFTDTVAFFNDGERFEYRRPDALVDTASGVVCSPDNYANGSPDGRGVLRITVLANHDRWCALPEEEYVAAKEELAGAALARAATLCPGLVALPGHTLMRDTFTPRTIRQFTGHLGGAVYGSTHKRLDGTTGIPGLFLCGTDQGFLGIVGALLSGVSMANRHGLVGATA